jgi:hypothetical protein
LTCAKCKLKLGKHLLDHQEHHSANKIDTNSDSAIHKQCYNYKRDHTNNFSDQDKFDEFTYNDLIKIQQVLRANQSDKNLISANDSDDTLKFNRSDEIFLIDNGLPEPLLTITNKHLGRQRLNFDQLTPAEQKLWNLFEKSDIYEFLTGEKTQCLNFVTTGSHFQPNPM